MRKKELSKLNIEINDRVAKNIDILMKRRNITYGQLQREIMKNEKYTISTSFLNKVLNHTEMHSMPLPFLMQICDYFNVSLDTMVKEDITNGNCYEKMNDIEKKLIDTQAILRADEEKCLNDKEQILKAEISENNANSVFIEDPKNILFSSYLQKYYCYFYPTASSENKEENVLLMGTMILKPYGDKCKVILNVDTKKKKNNSIVYKKYEGTAVISSSVQNVHCTLKSEEIGEFCYIIFRHFHLNYAFHDCHMAEILSTSSAGNSKKRYPTVLRMFLSREKIAEEDLGMISPYLSLNYSQITITQKNLFDLKEISEEYSDIVDELTKKGIAEHMYRFREKDVFGIAKNHLSEEIESIKFLTELRKRAYAYHYNKVSDTVEDTVRKLLISKGYYKNNIVN